MLVSALIVVLTISHAALFSSISDNISSLQRTCIDPNAKYDFPKDSLYGISMMSIFTYNLISFGLCIHLYVYLLNEEKKSTCRNRQIIGVSGLFQYYSETPKIINMNYFNHVFYFTYSSFVSNNRMARVKVTIAGILEQHCKD